jgi:CubicO group peptidase (beta-lactamase class C family)
MATIMRLVELNILSLDDKVTKYYPSFSKSNPELKLLHLMTHTSGYHLADDWVFDNDITL